MPNSNVTLKPILVIFAGAMAVTAMVLNGITWSKVRTSIDAVEAALQKKDSWEELLSTLKDAETGMRGYVITQDQRYLDPFIKSDDELNRIFNDLPDRGEGGGESGGESPETVLGIESLVGVLMDELKMIRVVLERDGFAEAQKIVREGKAKEYMDSLRRIVITLTKRQQKVVQETTAEMNRDLRWGYASALGAGMVALGAGMVAVVLLRESIQRARREQRLAEEKRRAESSNREKSAFLATMSHEIRTPMNAILGFGELLRDEVKDDKSKQYVESILVGGKSLLRIINDILDLSKVEAGMLEMKLEPTDLRETTHFIRQLFSHQAAKSGVELRIDVAEDLPSSLLIDGLRLRQILVNVVGNALKFTESGHVTLRVRDTPHESDLSRLDVLIEVEDTGRGIPKEQQADIFQPFVQAKGAKTEIAKGTGLGLAIVHRLTLLMGGKVTLESEAGRGSLFRFDFPNIEISARLAASAMEESEQVDFNDLAPTRILVADDNQTNLDLIAGIFEGTHHTLRLAANGREAVEAIAEEAPDLVLMDIRMPEMDGREALAAIRTTHGNKLLPVIAVTASSLLEEEGRLRDNFDGFVRKPFSRAELYEQMAQFIRPAESAEDEERREEAAFEGPESPETAEKWRKLAIALQDVREADWPRVRDGMVVPEIHAFAAKLESLATDARCRPLEVYARRLHSDADSFSPDALEKTLLDFPGLTDTVREAAAPSPE